MSRLEVHLDLDPDLGLLADAHHGTMFVVVVDDDHAWAELALPLDQARAWAGELFDAISVAYRQATGDPHALSDYMLAGLPDPDAYQPESTLLLHGDGDRPARMRFTISLTVQGRCLDDADLRAAIVECLQARFNTTAVAVSNGQPAPGP